MLASCATAAKVGVNHAKADDLAGIIEDTDAHEEIFGDQGLPFAGGPKKTAYSGNIGLGVQKKDNGDDTVSVRFIAAVTLGEGDVAGTGAVWTRAVWNGSTGGVRKASTTKTSTKAYTSLYDGSDSLYPISTYNTEHSTSHTHFVVYTLLNIPAANASDYITAYVTVDSKPSDVVATTTDLSTNFTFPKAKIDQGYVGIKKTSSGFSVVDRDPDAGGNHARFVGVSLDAGDDFLIMNACEDYFAVHGFDMINLADSTDHFSQEGSSQFANAKNASTYNLFLSSGYETNNWIYVNAFVDKTVYLVPGAWDVDSAWFAAYSYGKKDAATKYERWYAQSNGTGTRTINLTYDPAYTAYVIFVRMDSAKTLDAGWGAKWNQTSDLLLSAGTTCTITAGGDNNQSWE